MGESTWNDFSVVLFALAFNFTLRRVCLDDLLLMLG